MKKLISKETSLRGQEVRVLKALSKEAVQKVKKPKYYSVGKVENDSKALNFWHLDKHAILGESPLIQACEVLKLFTLGHVNKSAVRT